MTSTAVVEKYKQGERTLGRLMHVKTPNAVTEQDLKIQIIMASLVTARGRQVKLERQLYSLLLAIGLRPSSKLILRDILNNSMSGKTLKINQHILRNSTGKQQLIVRSISGRDLIFTWSNRASNRANELMLSIRTLADTYHAMLIEQGLGGVFGKRLHASRSYRGLSQIMSGILPDQKKTTRGRLTDQTLLVTLRCFLDESMNLTNTARVLGLHRNTVLYRLTKLYQLTGLNPVSFVDAVILAELIAGRMNG